MFCPYCGTQNPDGSRFCRSCGASLEHVKVDKPAGPNLSQPSPAASGSLPPEMGSAPVEDAPGRSRRLRSHRVRPLIAVGAVAVAIFVLLFGVGVSVGDGPSTKGGVATVGGLRLGSLTVGGTTMGNTASCYARDGVAVSDGTYDYFVSRNAGGLCRARIEDSSLEVIVPLAQDWMGSLSYLSVDGDYLYYVRFDYDNDTATYTVHKTRTDGSNDQVLYTLPTDDSTAQARDMYLYDHVLYLVVTKYDFDSNDSTTYFETWTLCEDGTGLEKIDDTESSGSTEVFVTPHELYATYTERGADVDTNPLGKVYSSKPGDEDYSRIYRSSLGSISGAPIVKNDKLYVMETSYSSELAQVTEMGLDGSNVRTVYSCDTGGGTVTLQSVTDESVYLTREGVTDNVKGGSSFAVSLDDGQVTSLDDGSDELTAICCVGDHVLVFENGGRGYTGMAVSSYDLEGNKLHDYVTSS